MQAKKSPAEVDCNLRKIQKKSPKRIQLSTGFEPMPPIESSRWERGLVDLVQTYQAQLILPCLSLCLSGIIRDPLQPHMSLKAVNRWFLAVTLLRNPSLVKYCRQGRHFTATVVTLRSVNFDVPV